MLQKIIKLHFLLHVITALHISESDVEFRLFTRENPDIYVQLIRGQLSDNNFNATNPTICIIHGYINDGDMPWIKDMRDEYFKKDHFNIIVVNWSKVAHNTYTYSAYHTRDVGNFTGDLFIKMNEKYGLVFTDIHMIGHSLGAHVCGFAGKYVQSKTSLSIGRISALDPASPLFYGNECSERLCRNDAVFTDIIHTDAYRYGYGDPMGHADFYPNGGTAIQPGCLTRRRRQLLDDEEVYFNPGCSHGRSYQFFIESINSTGFVARECDRINYSTNNCSLDSIAIMGENIDLQTRGIYFLETNSAPKYAKN